MIDFRYHLVSLISVFLALAVGIVLGAGPLQNSLGSALTDQVSSLREDRNATHAQLEQTEEAVNQRDSYIEQAGSAILPGTLDGVAVGLVVLPEASSDDVEQVSAQLESAGAKVVGRLSLTSAWVDMSRETFRSTYAGQFGGYMEVPEAATGNAVLGRGLGVALSTQGADATSLTDLLTASDTPLVKLDQAPSEPVRAVVVVGPRAPQAAEPTSQPTADQSESAWTDALGGLADAVATVVVGDGTSKTGVVAQLRSAGAKVTTVDSVGQMTAAVSVPLAVAQTLEGTRQAYGFADGAKAVMPQVVKTPGTSQAGDGSTGGSDDSTGAGVGDSGSTEGQ